MLRQAGFPDAVRASAHGRSHATPGGDARMTELRAVPGEPAPAGRVLVSELGPSFDLLAAVGDRGFLMERGGVGVAGSADGGFDVTREGGVSELEVTQAVDPEGVRVGAAAAALARPGPGGLLAGGRRRAAVHRRRGHVVHASSRRVPRPSGQHEADRDRRTIMMTRAPSCPSPWGTPRSRTRRSPTFSSRRCRRRRHTWTPFALPRRRSGRGSCGRWSWRGRSRSRPGASSTRGCWRRGSEPSTRMPTRSSRRPRAESWWARRQSSSCPSTARRSARTRSPVRRRARAIPRRIGPTRKR